MIKRVAILVAVLGLARGCQAGWLNPSQPGFVLQTYTTYQPISGNNSGTITTNGNSFQFAGDNTALCCIGGAGAQFRGKNEGSVFMDSEGGVVFGAFGPLAVVTNQGKGSVLLGNLSGGQRALITDVAHASLLLGAGTVSNSQSVVVGDGNESHGAKSVTAGSFWAAGSGFFGNGGGLTNLPTDLTRFGVAEGLAVSGRVVGVETQVAALAAAVRGPTARYVAGNGAHVPPFTSWATAATNIQAAVDVAMEGETVWVSNGVYGTGARAAGSVSNRVVVTNTVTVRSVNGPGVTQIQGSSGVRGVCLADGAWLVGFTVTGAGSYSMDGGGVRGGALSNCVLSDNHANTGGGASASQLYHCKLTGNSAPGAGGGAYQCTLQNCLLVGNSSDTSGGAVLSTLYNCTLVDNSGDAGTSYYCTLYNCITSGNGNGNTECTAYYSLGRDYGGSENIGGDPLFVDEAQEDYRLKAGSPCINTGTNGPWTVGATDLDGQARVYPGGGRADMGAYEAVSDALAWHRGDDVVTAGQALGLGSVGQLMIRGGTQLVFVAGTVTNVLDSDVGTP